VFTISCNSASCERVFSLMKRMFGTEQLSAFRTTSGARSCSASTSASSARCCDDVRTARAELSVSELRNCHSAAAVGICAHISAHI
jgi:hypothetical protein